MAQKLHIPDYSIEKITEIASHYTVITKITVSELLDFLTYTQIKYLTFN